VDVIGSARRGARECQRQQGGHNRWRQQTNLELLPVVIGGTTEQHGDD